VGHSDHGRYEWSECYGSRSDGEPPSEVVVPDWSKHLRILAAFCQFLLAWLPLCACLGQLVCPIQRILLGSQLLGEDIFLVFQGLELKAHDSEFILVGTQRLCNFECSIGWLVVIWWGLCGKVFLGGSGIILVVLQRRVCGFSLVWCHRGLVVELGTQWAPLLGSRLPDPIKMHTRR